MASDSEDSEGEELGMIRPGLIRELRNVLDEYPDDGQILKEMIQNAEDAGARTVKVLTDRRYFNRDLDTKTRRKHPHLRFFQGPSLCVYNDAEFTDADWKGIRMLHTSIKEKDPLKVGRFGLGFKSVFHLTDRLVILSGDFIMYMDPFKGEDRYCTMKRIEKLKGKELESALHCVQGVFGVRRETLGVSGGHFAGTLFWFPLRQAASELSSTVYTQDKLQDLVNAFKAESRSMLLFLKNLERVELFWRDGQGTLQELFAVGLVDSCVDSVRQERQSFVSTLRQAGNGLPDTGVDCVAQVTMETVDHQVTMNQQNVCARETSSHGIQHWLVVHYHPGIEEMSQELVELCQDPELSYRPHVGVAIPLKEHNVAQTNPLEAETVEDHCSFQSQIFCFLPLPLHTRSPTGLPVHVNGYLALSQNRRHLKWPTQDQLANKAHLEPAVRWNCLVVRELVPTAYVRLLGRLREVYHDTPSEFFSAWPNMERVDDMWRPLVEPLYRALAADNSFYTQAGGDQWVGLTQCVLPAFSDDFPADETGAVLKVFMNTDQNLVLLPVHVKKALRDFGLLHGVQTISPLLVSRLLPGCVHDFTRQEKLSVLHYLCTSDNVSSLLEDKPLLPLSNGQFGVFRRRQTEASLTYFCEQELASLFPGLQDRFCDVTVPRHIWQHVKDIAQTGELSVRVLLPDDKQVPNLLASSVHARCSVGALSLSSDDPWLPQVWQFLSSTAPWSSDLGPLLHVPLLPCQTGKTMTLCPLRGLYVCSAAPELPPLTSDLTQSLGKLLVIVIPQLPDYVTRHSAVLGQLVHYPSLEGVMALLDAVGSDATLCQEAVQQFNDAASTAEREAMVSFISEVTTVASHALRLLQQLKLFTNISGEHASVQETLDILPDCSLPLHPPRPFLNISGPARSAAAKLGARQPTLQETVAEILQLLVSENHFTGAEPETFMSFFLHHETLYSNSSLLDAARQVRFVRTGNGQVRKAEDLYDPQCPILAELFLGEDRFPHGDFAKDSMLTNLRKMGLRTTDQVEPADLITTAQRVQNLFQTEVSKLAEQGVQEQRTASRDVSSGLHKESGQCFRNKCTSDTNPQLSLRKANGLLEFLCKQGTAFDCEVLSQISVIQCLPCLQQFEKPEGYPQSLPLKSTPVIVKPADMCHHTLIKLMGSTSPVLKGDMPDYVVRGLQVATQPVMERLLKHLQTVTQHYQPGEMSQYRLIQAEIFRCLTSHSSLEEVQTFLQQHACTLVESGDRFVHPHKFWVQRHEDDIGLRPYRFPLPLELVEAQELFLECRSSKRQDSQLLQTILEEIRDSYERQTTFQTITKDLQLIKRILDTLMEQDSVPKGLVLLPIVDDIDHGLKFRAAAECTVTTGKWYPHTSGSNNDEDEIYFVHPDIPIRTALALGALELKDRALTGVEELDFGYGQSEELTTRLHNLLEESYTDGFSVPKELIQNADDAGATEVCFLLDERENSDARCNLISDNMASLQGPAIWAYNNATFTDEDFENIRKLGAGTKREDASKVGRFGLGFNAVYNLTDAPSFISRHVLAIFDPHAKYIPGEGLRLDFRNKVNRSLLTKMPQQFRPYQHIFGCNLQNSSDVCYDGTLFRLPLRTPDQAAQSKIKSESYSDMKRKEFLRMLLERAGSLLMFTQTVKKLQVYHLSSKCRDPADAQCLLTVTKTSNCQVLHPLKTLDGTILKHCTSHWSEYTDIQILEDVSIDVRVSKNSERVCGVEASHAKTHWKLAWTTGTGDAARIAQRSGNEGLVPLATVAVQLEQNCVTPLSDSPPGFYRSGHLFCFLPLPEEMAPPALPVHINGTFALTSSRRSLLERTEDDVDASGFLWNAALFRDAVCRAFLLLLETLQAERLMDLGPYYELWPNSGDLSQRLNFYSRLMSDGNKVFPVPGWEHWVAFHEAWFLEPSFRRSSCGQLALSALQQFIQKDRHLVDMPNRICSILEENHSSAFQGRVISTEVFYKDVFFPNIHSDWWVPHERNRLTIHALNFFLDVRKFTPTQFISSVTRNKEFVSTESGVLKRPDDLYDPNDDILKKLFCGDDKFPSHDFCPPGILQQLVRLGLWRETVKKGHLIDVAGLIEELDDAGNTSLAVKKAEGLWELLVNYGLRIQPDALSELSTLRCLMRMQEPEKPSDFPSSVPLMPGSILARPADMCRRENLRLAGCVLPVMRPRLPQQVVEALGVPRKPAANHILEHLRILVCNFHQTEVNLYRFAESDVVKALKEHTSDQNVVETLQREQLILVESGEVFVTADKFWTHRLRTDIDLRPYRFPLPKELKHSEKLFSDCGSSTKQDAHLLQRVLEDIKHNHEAQLITPDTFQRDLQIVKQILDALKTCNSIPEGTVLLPIEHTESSVLRFKPACECTVGSAPWSFWDGVLDDDEEQIFYVHQDIHNKTAKALGALEIRQRALTEAEDLDFGCGQHEDLTTRLHSLLEESYTDGFSVPKELIQNADDAGATEVCFLLDERENSDARCDLITEKMASLQGPAVWAFNNATFSDLDFQNITKLGAGTKKEDASKVGRFGLGFNAVYNLTDAPSFISRHILAIFDPQKEYLEKGAGLKLDFSRKKNLSLLSRMPRQFQPFQNVFGCILQTDVEVNYNGTLFRFPLRTPEQAESSKLKAESYSQEKCHEFLRLLLHRAGSLLMFTQSVQKIQVFHLSKECSDPSTANCLLTVTRASSFQLLQPPSSSVINSTILQYCTAQWPRVKDIKILEDVSIEMKVVDEAKAVCGVQASHVTTDWKLAWATGTGASAEAAQCHRQEGLVPLAAVAVQLQNNGIVPPIENLAGFYTSGHLFCFLPLPEEMVRMSLQVHINGTFALTSSRRSLLVKTEDDIKSSGHDWNSALFGDAVCRAYLTVLENMKVHVQTISSYEGYFSLWPDSGDFSLDSSFYRRLVSGRDKVFPVPGQDEWVAFQDCWFLDPVLSESDCGQIAWDAARCFWNREGRLVDVPVNVCHLIIKNGQAEAFQTRMITLKDFLKSFLFPNIDSTEWLDTNRDKLVLLALEQRDSDIQDLLSSHACIPCLGGVELKRPSDLIHPRGAAAKLYLPEDNRFPQGAAITQSREEPTQNFCSHEVLCCLEELGMIRDDLPWPTFVERVNSVSRLVAEDQNLALKRTVLLVEYLSSLKGSLFRIQHCPQDVIETLSKTSFLPVLAKPDDWPFPWFTPKQQLLAAPRELFSDHMKELVGCHAKLLNTALMKSVSSASRTVDVVLECLGVRMKDKIGDKELTGLAIDQLLTISQHSRENSSVERTLVQTVCSAVYKFLTRSLNGDGNDTGQNITERLSGTQTVWTGTEFVLSTRVAFRCSFDCSPYLFRVETASSDLYRRLLQLMGVKEMFETEDILWVLDEVRTEYKDKQLCKEKISLVSGTAQLLCQTIKTSKTKSLKSTDVFLPDRKGYMMPTCQLCLDDCEWLKETETMKFVHDAIPPETAKSLGVETKRGMDFDQLMLPMEFGQSEKLTSRIKRLLEGYTFDSSFFKELIQNADDAGATEIRFFLDSRSLDKNRVPENWSPHLQGPALCVYNNRSFTTKDIEGIQNLGEGSKGEDLIKTGKYGVGFNAVYHITDVPSFWTRENDKDEVICIFDPNCKYVRNTHSGKPGVKLGNVDRIREAYPDMFAGYLQTSVDMSAPGTMFRFPLRTQAMARKSYIKTAPVTQNDIKQRLKDFESEGKNCLLFLNNLRKIGIYSVRPDGTVKSDYVVESHIEETSSPELTKFKTHLQRVTKGVTNKNLQLHQISELEAVVHISFKDSGGKEEDWVTVNRLGFRSGTDFSQQLLHEWQQEHFRLLPRGGVAVRLAPDTRTQNHFAFCILPLPLPTKLPMHINGHFALDHETRRNLWKHEGDARTEWNTLTILQLIVPAYIAAIQCLRKKLFETETLSKQEMSSRLRYYHTMFPDPLACPSDCWVMLVKELYRQIAEQELCLFPVLQNNIETLEWVPAYKRNGFHGYFSDLENFFKNKHDECHDKPVVLTQSGVSQAGSRMLSSDSYRQHTKKLHTILKDLNMKVVESSFEIYRHFNNSGVTVVQQVTPSSVTEFLRSASSGRRDGCSLSVLPQPVASTPLRTPGDVRFLIDFVRLDDGFLQQLAELPLSLRQSGNLYYFRQDRVNGKPIVSKFFGLLKGSADLFLHENIFTCFQPVSQHLESLLRELDIPTFAELLPQSLPESQYKTGQPCDMQTDMRTWIYSFWDFVQDHLKHFRGECEVEIRQRTENMLQSLNDWSLLPARNTFDGAGSYICLLYPLKHRHRVVHLTEKRDQSHSSMWKILQKLPLAFLQNRLLPALSVATNIVASLRHPVALLHALTFCRQGLNTVTPYASDILLYFSNSLSALLESCSDLQLQEMLKNLPFFTTIDGRISDISGTVPTVCLERTFPPAGLVEWSQRRPHPLHLLQSEQIPVDLQKFLGCSTPTLFEFYQWLLSSLEYLPDDDILTHITHLKISLKSLGGPLVQLLKSTCFVVVNGRRYRGSHFYALQEPVFKAMLPEDCFPPPPYCMQDWEPFMRVAGMVCDVTEELFIHFAQQLEGEGRAGLTTRVIKKSEVLVEHLFERQNVDLLPHVKNISFVRPSDWASSQNGRSLSSAVEPYPADRLVSFAESCQEKHLHLVWSTSCILHKNANPSRYCKFLSHVRFLETPPSKKVLDHIRNLCFALSGDNVDRIGFKLQNVSLFMEVFENIYQHLKTFTDAQLNELRRLPIICDISSKRMLIPDTVVIELREEEAIKGYIYKSPEEFGKFNSLFEQLGVSRRVTATHYARVLSTLKSQSGDEPLHVEEMKVAIQAVTGLFNCLKKSREEDRCLHISHVYLPSDKEKLLESSKLVFVDNKPMYRRLQKVPEHLPFFIGFDKLKIPVPFPQKEVKLLPDSHQMMLLSRLIKEVVTEDAKKEAVEGGCSRRLQEMFTKSKFVHAVIRLVHDHYSSNRAAHPGQFTSEDAEQVRECLSRIYMREVAVLQTILLWKEDPVHGTEQTRVSFVEKQNKNSVRSCIVYVSRDSVGALHNTNETLLRSLRTAVEFVLDIRFVGDMLQCTLRDVDDALRFMDEEGVPQCDFSNQQDKERDSVIPLPGDFVPVVQHCYLDNNFYVFEKGEHVGFEVYDPSLEQEETTEDEAVYIYAIVIGEAEQDGHVPLLARRYLVDLGLDRGTIEVSVTKLYKFIRKARKGTSSAMVPYEDDSGTDSEEIPLPDMGEALREIRRTLTEAWRLPDEKDRMRVVKRLLLKWHPDKNKGNEQFCTRVFQKLQHYVELLKQGKRLPEDEDDVDGSFHRSRGRSSSSPFDSGEFSSFFEFMFRRGRSYHRQYESDFSRGPSTSSRGYSNGNGHGGSSYYSASGASAPNPQPGEGRRWLRQAEADVAAAQSARNSCLTGHNWVCYQCHQAVEKALKAVLYCRDAGRYLLQSHDLRSLAQLVNDSELCQLACSIESRVGSHMRMRYPDVLQYPRIPNDVYSTDDANFALDVATRVLVRVKSLV